MADSWKAPLISLMSQPDNEAVAVPDLYVVIVKQTFCIGDGFAIVPANHLLSASSTKIGKVSNFEQTPQCVCAVMVITGRLRCPGLTNATEHYSV